MATGTGGGGTGTGAADTESVLLTQCNDLNLNKEIKFDSV